LFFVYSSNSHERCFALPVAETGVKCCQIEAAGW
jgi:hypothetical protein